MTMRTPLKTVRWLGSARDGTDHFWTQRLTGVANLLLVGVMVLIGVKLAGADHATVAATLARPMIALPVVLFVLSAAVHMRIGMQVIIEDYVRGEGAKIALLMLNTFFAVLVGAASILAVLKLSFGG